MKTVLTATSGNVKVVRTIYYDVNDDIIEDERRDIKHRAEQLNTEGFKPKSPRMIGEE